MAASATLLAENRAYSAIVSDGVDGSGRPCTMRARRAEKPRP